VLELIVRDQLEQLSQMLIVFWRHGWRMKHRITAKLPDFPVTVFSRIRRLRQPDLYRECKLSDQSLVIGALSGLDSAPGGKVGCWGRLFSQIR
jgi:hypothetical protein